MLTVFTDTDFTYLLLRIGRLRIGWYEGFNRPSVWMVR